jgi:transcription elongation GreA/GreB family factor
MSFKNQIYHSCVSLLESKIHVLRHSLFELTAGAENDSKSSVGDKHETARAMMQLEFEKGSNQLAEMELQLEALQKIDISIKHTLVGLGCYLKTDKALFFLSVGLGKLKVNEDTVIVLSPQSPLGHLFMGLKVGATVEFNGVRYTILEIE